MKNTFYSNGKLLLTGEYLVLDGATALAIPTKKGQSLLVTPLEEKELHWKSYDSNKNCWYGGRFRIIENAIETSAQDKTSTVLKNIIEKAKLLNPTFLSENYGYSVETYLDFPRDWGLGSSSTLINNIAQWANVNAFQLLENSFGGSGYDIAAAQHDKPILYTKERSPLVNEVHLPWEFTDQLFFVHLNNKQDSKKGIELYREKSVEPKVIQKISDLSAKLLLCYDLDSFEKIMMGHEQTISGVLNMPTVKDRLFPDYPNTIKSLGAWGGDFVLATGTTKEEDYFKKKGFETIVPFRDMIK